MNDENSILESMHPNDKYNVAYGHSHQTTGNESSLQGYIHLPDGSTTNLNLLTTDGTHSGTVPNTYAINQYSWDESDIVSISRTKEYTIEELEDLLGTLNKMTKMVVGKMQNAKGVKIKKRKLKL